MFKKMARGRVDQVLTRRVRALHTLPATLLTAVWALAGLDGCQHETIDLLPPSDSDASSAGRSFAGLGTGGTTSSGGSQFSPGNGGTPEAPWWTGGDTGRGGTSTQPPGSGGSSLLGTEGSDCHDADDCLGGLVCHPFFGKCEPACRTDEDCDEPSRPLCDRESGPAGLCVQCLSNADCAHDPFFPVCLPYMHFCAECTSDNDCEAPNPYCHSSLFVCLHCLEDSHCPEGTYCDPMYNQCQECLADEHCRDPERPHCDLFVCRECLFDPHCPDGSYCDRSRFECVPWSEP